jgi:RNA polymerase sigma-32 factor
MALMVDDIDTHRANQAYIKRSIRTPLLDGDSEQEIAASWRSHRDEAALHRLVTAYARMVVPFAMKYRRYGVPVGDLIQEGNVGLLQAAARFDPERGVRFSSYAAWWIRARMQDFILRNWSIVRAGTTTAQRTLFFNLRRLQAKIADSGGRMPADGHQRVAAALNVRVADVIAMAERLAQSDQSLNATIDEDGGEWQDLLPDMRPSPEDAAIAELDTRQRSKWLAGALAELSARERLVIQQRRLEDDGATLEEVGNRLGVSKERVRQIEHRALDKLRAALLRSRAQPAAR